MSKVELMLWGIVVVQAWLFYFLVMSNGNFYVPLGKELLIPQGVMSQEQEVRLQSHIWQLRRGVDVGKHVTIVSVFTCLLTGGLAMGAAVSVRNRRLRSEGEAR